MEVVGSIPQGSTMKISTEPLYKTYAKRMLGVDKLPESLEKKLAMTEEMVQTVKPCGCLSSTQTIASIILMWELEQTLEHFELKHRDANY